jgi:hypothetical protein
MVAQLIVREEDLGDLREFALSWRFTEHRTALATHELGQLRPLRRPAAQQVHELTLGLQGIHGLLVPVIASINTADVSEETVSAWLAALPLGHPDDAVVLSWDQDNALQAPLGVFVTHWSDFCYPASDDVTVLPLDLSWVLAYWHEESFFYSRDATSNPSLQRTLPGHSPGQRR